MNTNFLTRSIRRFVLATSIRALVPAALLASAGQAMGDQTLPFFFTDFDTGTPGVITGGGNTGVQFFAGLGSPNNQFTGNLLQSGDTVTLTLGNLPAYTGVKLSFLLGIIETWDGPPGGMNGAPDYFSVTIDQTQRLLESFNNRTDNSEKQNLPTTYTPPAGGLLSSGRNLFNSGFSGQDGLDTAYNMEIDPAFQLIPHVAGTLTVQWKAFGAGWEGVGNPGNESFALDNVRVELIVPNLKKWTGAQGTDFAHDRNWEGDQLPLATDFVQIDGTGNPAISNANGVHDALFVTGGSTVMSAGAYTLTSSLNMSGASSLQITSGDVSCVNASLSANSALTLRSGAGLAFSGSLNISNSKLFVIEVSTVTGSAGTVTLDAGATGYVNSGGLLDVDHLHVGNQSPATMLVDTGGILLVNSLAIASGAGSQNSQNSRVSLIGNSRLRVNAGPIIIGGSGEGTLSLIHSVLDWTTTQGPSITLGFNATAYGNLELDNNSDCLGDNLSAVDQLTVGRAGKGNVKILGGSRLFANHVVIGEFPGSDGHAVVSGQISSLNVFQDMAVGAQGHGSLDLIDQAEVSGDNLILDVGVKSFAQVTIIDSTLSAQALRMATEPGSSAILIASGNSLITAGFVSFGLTNTNPPGGSGQISLITGARMVVGNPGDTAFKFNVGPASAVFTVNFGATLLVNGSTMIGTSLGPTGGFPARLIIGGDGTGTASTARFTGPIALGTSRVGGKRRVEKLNELMTACFPPLIKPCVRFSRTRLSECRSPMGLRRTAGA